MKSWMLAFATVLLAACASAPTVAPPSPALLFADPDFAPPSERVDARDVFALSPAMQQYLNAEIIPRSRLRDARQALIDALYTKGRLKLDYDSAMTRNAAQAFDARSGNCLSLVIMTAAFAKALQLPIQYQSVYVEDTWSREGDLYFANGHVNLTLSRRASNAVVGYDAAQLMVIDFVPPEDIARERSHTIGEDTILAMYMNNRAAEALADQRLDDAYWWAREAIRQAPRFLSAYNTLGVVYRRHGDARRAERVFDYVLAVEPANTLVMSNLVLVLRDLGRQTDADALARQLAQIEPTPPFHFFNLGLAAMQRGDFRTAKDMFAKEVDRAAYYHEFHFWLALADYGLGETGEARKHLELALENSTTRHDHDLYAAKLDRLRSHHF